MKMINEKVISISVPISKYVSRSLVSTFEKYFKRGMRTHETFYVRRVNTHKLQDQCHVCVCVCVYKVTQLSAINSPSCGTKIHLKTFMCETRCTCMLNIKD